MAIDHIARRDSDGVTHYVDRQDEPMSCALACIGMAWEQTRQQCSVRQESGYKIVSGQFPQSLLASQLAGDNGGLGWGTWAINVSSTLQAIGIPVTKTDSFNPAPGNYGFVWRKPRIQAQHPAIILVGWYSTGANGALTRNGGHFIVASRVTNHGWVVVLDPASGTLHELHGSRGHYNNHNLHGLMEVVIYTG